VVQVGSGPAAAVCGRMLADLGATVATTAAAPPDGPLTAWLDHGRTRLDGAAEVAAALAAADVVVCEGGPAALRRAGHDPDALRAAAPSAAIVAISPYGQTGPRADDPATDLTLFCASGIARLLTGQVDDLAEAPIRPVGEQSAFIAGLAAACAGLNAALLGDGAFVDVSGQEALATLAMTELARAGSSGEGWSRRRLTDGNGATVTISGRPG
jgi:benzylsuccinate CoA-transferase BbsE subunit